VLAFTVISGHFVIWGYCKGAEITFSVPLRYHQVTTTNFIVWDGATNTAYYVCRHPLPHHLMEAKRSFISHMKETNFFIHEISQNQAICKHVTLCLVCQISFCSSTFPKNP